jgi:hypothetical protein
MKLPQVVRDMGGGLRTESTGYEKKLNRASIIQNNNTVKIYGQKV